VNREGLYPSRVLPRRWPTALLVAALAASTLLGVSLAMPGPAAGLGPLPACRYDDILTAPRGYDDWSITLVDTILRVTKSYVPPDLEPVSDAGIGGSGKIRAVAVADLHDLAAAAKAAGNPVAVVSAYRSFVTQQSVFRGWVDQSGYKQALLYSARPGHSEHQLGLAIDFKTAGGGVPWSGSDWGKSPAGTWMRRHAWEYGWVQSYPKGKRATTCYAYESWHFRYVGRDLAAAIHASGLTPREYLWANFTTAVVPTASAPAPSASAPGSPVPSPVASSEPSPSVGPGASPGPASPSLLASPSAGPTEALASPSAGPSGPSPAGSGSAPALVGGVGLALGMVALAAVLALRRRSGQPGP